MVHSVYLANLYVHPATCQIFWKTVAVLAETLSDTKDVSSNLATDFVKIFPHQARREP